MIASTTPGLAVEVFRVDAAHRIRVATARGAVTEMERELRIANAAARGARRSAWIAAHRRRLRRPVQIAQTTA